MWILGCPLADQTNRDLAPGIHGARREMRDRPQGILDTINPTLLIFFTFRTATTKSALKLRSGQGSRRYPVGGGEGVARRVEHPGADVGQGDLARRAACHIQAVII